MDNIMKIVMFSILLNFSVGIMIYTVPAFEDNMLRGGIKDTSGSTEMMDLSSSLNKTINIVNQQSNEGTGIIQWVMDLTIIKAITSVVQAIPNFLYGFITVLQPFFSGWLGEPLNTVLFFGIRSILTIMYGLVAFSLITGRKIL